VREVLMDQLRQKQELASNYSSEIT